MAIRRTILLVGSSIAAALLFGCGRDWDAFDPRLGTSGAGAGGASTSSSSSGMVGQSSSSASGMGGSGGAGTGGSGGAGGSPCKATLHDDFNDGTIETVTTWEVIEDNTNVDEADGSLAIQPVDPAQSSYGELRSKQAYDVSGCGVLVQFREVPNPDTSAYMGLVLRVGDDYLEIGISGGGVHFTKTIGNQQIYIAGAPYDPSQHAYLRIREAAGTTYWDTSPDGKQWSNGAQEANPLPFDAIRVGMTTGIGDAASSPGRGVFDNISIAP
ncbi:hypothetical protein [Polyangium aurulentum]|uniref:hypothetical protein n=1 Tax=Polyangium aurulentum TaxID=2567896 RepID=UPI0010ADFA7F|nr:hypothetical protein [Polyangium aurulentum]UQA63115.1 hypothetical protein E8A73_022690 [Polyangium aurulentum]